MLSNVGTMEPAPTLFPGYYHKKPFKNTFWIKFRSVNPFLKWITSKKAWLSIQLNRISTNPVRSAANGQWSRFPSFPRAVYLPCQTVQQNTCRRKCLQFQRNGPAVQNDLEYHRHRMFCVEAERPSSSAQRIMVGWCALLCARVFRPFRALRSFRFHLPCVWYP